MPRLHVNKKEKSCHLGKLCYEISQISAKEAHALSMIPALKPEENSRLLTAH